MQPEFNPATDSRGLQILKNLAPHPPNSRPPRATPSELAGLAGCPCDSEVAAAATGLVDAAVGVTAAAFAVVLDGIAGMFQVDDSVEKAYVNSRKGIVKIALRSGAPLGFRNAIQARGVFPPADDEEPDDWRALPFEDPNTTVNYSSVDGAPCSSQSMPLTKLGCSDAS